MTDISFLRSLSPSRVNRTGKLAAVLLAGLPVSASFAADFTWEGATGSFTDATQWTGDIAPLGTDGTDVLIFAGTTTLPYTASSDSTTNPFFINQLVFNATGSGAGVSQTIAGSTPIKLGGFDPKILQNGSGDASIKIPVQLGGDLTLDGVGVGTFPNETNRITLDGALSGLGNITKNGSFTFRFGSLANTAYSQNTWFGGLTINAGIIRFNNNAYAGPTALRSNPVTMNGASALLYAKPESSDPSASLRLGTLNGSAGTVHGERGSSVVGAVDSLDIVITTLTPGTFGGTVKNNFFGAGNNGGKLVIRGVATQTFTGILSLAKDVSVGRGAGMTLAGNTAHQGQTTSSAVIVAGGTFTLDNTATNNNDRLRNGLAGETGLEPIGGGKFSLIGNAAGTVEDIGRLQLGSPTAARSGALTINVTTNGGTGTTLRMASYGRNNASIPLNTVNFTANDTAASLGTSATGARVLFNLFTVPLQSQLLASTNGAGNIGWATVNGRDFATYDTTLGVQAVGTSPMPAGTGTGNSGLNAILTSDFTISSVNYALNSLKIEPTSAGLSLDLTSAGNFLTHGILLAGSTDYEIKASAGGKIGSPDGVSPRYFHVHEATLTVGASLNAFDTPVVKAGAGLLKLTNSGNLGVTKPFSINEGTVRATPGVSLPDGELRFRGGVLEIEGGVTFNRQIGGSTRQVNWSGLGGISGTDPIAEEQGSGGFAAFGADAAVFLTAFDGGLALGWEGPGFINSGQALVFGSTRADAKLTWQNLVSLTAIGQASNYNAREIRVVDNPGSTSDLAEMSGVITGVVHDDLLKTGAGTLILSNAANDYRGATLVHEGALLVNGTLTNSFLTNVRNTATLGGNGTIAGRVKVESGGTIAPGNRLGNTSKLTTGDVILSDVGARLALEFGGTTIGGDGLNGYDQLVALGEVVLNGGTLVATLLSGFLPESGTLFFVVSNDGVDPVQGTFAQGSQILLPEGWFDISYAGNFTGDPQTSTFTGGNDIVLQYVPEPTSAALLACGAAALGLARRRRQA